MGMGPSMPPSARTVESECERGNKPPSVRLIAGTNARNFAMADNSGGGGNTMLALIVGGLLVIVVVFFVYGGLPHKSGPSITIEAPKISQSK
jgi:hypothetical protein